MQVFSVFFISLWVLFVPSFAVQASSLKGETITFCGDGSGWPPYTYVSPSNPREIQGFDVDVVREILNEEGIQSRFIMPSWKQCLNQTEKGDLVQVALSSSYSDERAAKFLYTHQYYTTVLSYFYARNRFPKSPDIDQASDLFLHGPVCGRYAYNYEGSGVLKNAQIQQSGKSFEALVARTSNGGCAFFLARPSIIFGFKLVGKEILNVIDFGYAPLPEARKDDFYMLISKNYKYSKDLKVILDEGILRMKKNGRLKEILDRYYSKMQLAK